MDREDQFIIGGLTRPLLFLWLASILLEKKKVRGTQKVSTLQRKRENAWQPWKKKWWQRLGTIVVMRLVCCSGKPLRFQAWQHRCEGSNGCTASSCYFRAKVAAIENNIWMLICKMQNKWPCILFFSLFFVVLSVFFLTHAFFWGHYLLGLLLFCGYWVFSSSFFPPDPWFFFWVPGIESINIGVVLWFRPREFCDFLLKFNM